MYVIAVVLLNALTFASLAYIANRKGYHAMAALAAAGTWLFGVTGGVLIWGIWRWCPGRFPPPWYAEETDAWFIVRDANGQALAYVYFEEEPGRRPVSNRRWSSGPKPGSSTVKTRTA
jgi:hypothetical protein